MSIPILSVANFGYPSSLFTSLKHFYHGCGLLSNKGKNHSLILSSKFIYIMES